MDIENLSKSFKEDGYIYIDNFFDENLMDNYHRKILSHFKKDTYCKFTNDDSKSALEITPSLNNFSLRL